MSIVGTGVLIVVHPVGELRHDFDNWLVSVVVWISAWAGVMLVDFFVFRRGKIDVPALYDAAGRRSTATSTGRP